MNRFFCPSTDIANNEIVIKDKQKVRHITRSLCLKPKEKVLVFDENGFEYLCVISKIEDKVFLEVKKKSSPDKNYPKINLTIACAIPKKAKFDDIVDKLTQLGVSRIIPLITQRVIVKLGQEKEERRLKRWRRIAESASQQSQRHDIPLIGGVQDFKKLILESENFNLKLIPTLFGKRKSIKEALSSLMPSSLDKAKILCLIGPEGDFSKEEVDIAKKAGFVPISLGDLVLRVDTAAIALASYLSIYKR